MSLIPSWQFYIKSAMFSVILVCASVTMLIVGPALETAYYPVVSVLSIDKIEPVNSVSTRVWASYRKLRPCEYVGIAWYSFDKKTEIIHQVGWLPAPKNVNDTSSPTRPVGHIVAGPWTVSMPATDIRGKSLVEVFHRCSVLWISRSHYYP